MKNNPISYLKDRYKKRQVQSTSVYYTPAEIQQYREDKAQMLEIKEDFDHYAQRLQEDGHSYTITDIDSGLEIA